MKKTTKKKTPTLSADALEEKIKKEVCQSLYDVKGPIHCEFSRILCVSCGVLWKNQDENFYNIKIISFYDEDEKKILVDFINHPKLSEIFGKIPGKFDKNRDLYWALVGHNISVFDLPVLSKRMIINGLKPPAMFDVAHLKSWDLADVIIDTKSAWSFNVFDNSTSLELLCDIFNVPTPKDGISGADVKDVFYKEKNLKKIAEYCEKDVVALARVYLRMKSMPEEIKVFNPVVTTEINTSVEKKEETPA